MFLSQSQSYPDFPSRRQYLLLVSLVTGLFCSEGKQDWKLTINVQKPDNAFIINLISNNLIAL